MKHTPLFKYPGGKSYLLKWTMEQIPTTSIFVDLFGGAANMVRASKSPIRIYNDADDVLYMTINEVVTNPSELHSCLSVVAYSNITLEGAKAVINNHRSGHTWSRLNIALSEIIRRRMSRGGLGKSFAWSNRQRGGQAGDLNAWMNFVQAFPSIAESLKDVTCHCQDFEQIIDKYDGPNAFFYMDPPYHPETRTDGLYDVEFSRNDYQRLFSSLKSVKGKVALAGYYHEDYKVLGWNYTEKSYKNNMAQTSSKSGRVECLWKNY